MASSPVLSVIIPVYNDPIGLEQTLSSLINQCDAPIFEIIVVDNESTDATPNIVEEFEETHPDLVFGYSETDIQSSYAARNTGVEEASGEILAFLDADETVKDDWAADIYECFRSTNIDYLGCNVKISIPNGEDTIWARYDVAMGLPVEHYLRTKQFAPTCALAVRNEVIEEAGRFDETLISGGDKEFGKRVRNHGFTLGYASHIVVEHPARTSLDSLMKKATRIGEGQVQLWKRHDLAIHPVSPLRFLPPSPERVRNRTQSDRLPLTVYLISYFLKLIQTLRSVRVYCRDVLG